MQLVILLLFFALVKKRIFFFFFLSTTQSGPRPQKSSCLCKKSRPWSSLSPPAHLTLSHEVDVLLALGL